MISCLRGTHGLGFLFTFIPESHRFMSLSVTDAVKTRISTRAFLDKPVGEEQVREILDIARWSPSGGNLQPWRVHVVLGEGRKRFAETVQKAVAENPMGEESELEIYPPKLADPWRSRRFQIGEDMYALLGIPREDKAARLMHLARNYNLFDAPVGLFFSIDKCFGKGQWSHLGMFMQTIALVAEEKGLATCMQEAWIPRGKTVAKFFGIPDNEQFYCGMALGYADKSKKVNELRSARVEVDEFATFVTE